MKTKLLTTTLLLASIALFAQEDKNKVFYLDSLNIVTTEKNYAFTRVVEDYSAKKNLYAVSEYYKSGKLKMSATTKDKDKIHFIGTRTDYYENGNKKQESNYVDNKLNGKQINWYENAEKKSEKEITWDVKNKSGETKVLQFWNSDGTQTVTDGNGNIEETNDKIYEKGEIKNGIKEGIWRGKNLKEKYIFTEIYKNGELVSGISTDENDNKFPYEELMLKPTPEKGMADFYKHIAQNYKTPKIQGLQGKVYLSFIVDKEGNLTNYKILRDIGYGTGEEGIKSISSYGKWMPGKMRGITTKVLYNIPIAIKAKESNRQQPSNGFRKTQNN